ncbi:hypothetical protein Hdeb2414_s0020g00556771 [Helianthus debilis subsp. tardiflorus]
MMREVRERERVKVAGHGLQLTINSASDEREGLSEYLDGEGVTMVYECET